MIKPIVDIAENRHGVNNVKGPCAVIATPILKNADNVTKIAVLTAPFQFATNAEQRNVSGAQRIESAIICLILAGATFVLRGPKAKLDRYS